MQAELVRDPTMLEIKTVTNRYQRMFTFQLPGSLLFREMLALSSGNSSLSH